MQVMYDNQIKIISISICLNTLFRCGEIHTFLVILKYIKEYFN